MPTDVREAEEEKRQVIFSEGQPPKPISARQTPAPAPVPRRLSWFETQLNQNQPTLVVPPRPPAPAPE